MLWYLPPLAMYTKDKTRERKQKDGRLRSEIALKADGNAGNLQYDDHGEGIWTDTHKLVASSGHSFGHHVGTRQLVRDNVVDQTVGAGQPATALASAGHTSATLKLSRPQTLVQPATELIHISYTAQHHSVDTFVSDTHHIRISTPKIVKLAKLTGNVCEIF